MSNDKAAVKVSHKLKIKIKIIENCFIAKIETRRKMTRRLHSFPY